MSDLNTNTWKYFKIIDLFDISNGKRLTRANMAFGGKTPYIGSIASNNGVFSYIKQEPIDKGNSISVAYNGSIGETFYQPKPFWGTDDINILKPKFKLNSYIALFLCPIIKQEKYRFNYGRKWNIKRMKQTKIKLPITVDGKPDFEFMENYIENLPAFKKLEEAENLQESIIDNRYELNTNNWQYFKLDDIFDDISENGKCNNSKLLKKGNDINYIGAKKNNNGVISKVKKINNLITKGNCIVLISNGQGSAGYSLYQPGDFIGSSSLKIGRMKNLNQFIALFIVTVLDLERFKYSFGRSWNTKRIKNTRIKLPVNSNGKPDFEFMENYIKSLPYSKSL